MTMAVLASLLLATSDAYAQNLAAASTRGVAAAAGTVSTGIRTDRLKPGHIRIWKAIEKVILAVDREGRPVRPALHRLLQWAKESEHAIYVEMFDHEDANFCSAAEFIIENSGQDQRCWTAAIRFNLSVIQAAGAKVWVDGNRREISLRGIGRNVRCAGFLGHELIHASLILENPEHARLYQEYERATIAYYSARALMSANQFGKDPAMQGHMKRMKTLLDQLEAPADAVEMELWRELVPGVANNEGRK